jgi:hypothetical protein
MIVGQIVIALVVFGKRQDADVERPLVLAGSLGFYQRRAVRIDQRGDDIGVEPEAPFGGWRAAEGVKRPVGASCS